MTTLAEKIRIFETGGHTGEPSIPTNLLDMAKEGTTNFLQNIASNIDFELATKNDPKDYQGTTLPGKWEILNLYRHTGPKSKSFYGYIILYPIGATYRGIKNNEEDIYEGSLRNWMAGLPDLPMDAQVGTKTKTFEQPFAPDAEQQAAYDSVIKSIPKGTKTYVAPTAPIQAPTTIPKPTSPLKDIDMPTLAPPVAGDSWSMTGWASSGHDTFSMAPILTYKGQQYNISSPQQGEGLLTQLKSFGLSGYIDEYIQQFRDLYTGVTNPTPPGGTSETRSAIHPEQTYIIYQGSPNVFERKTGRWISATEASQLGIGAKNLIYTAPKPRPEVKTGSDFAKWDGKNLTIFPA